MPDDEWTERRGAREGKKSLTGDLEVWYRIAVRLNKFPTEVIANTTATGYIRWQTLFEKEVNEPKPEHYYLAALNSTLECIPFLVWGKEPPKELREIKTFMLKFGTAEEMERKAVEVAEARMVQDAEFSRSVWLSGLGITLGADGKPIPREKPKTQGQPRTLPPHVRQATANAPATSGGGFPSPGVIPAGETQDFAPTASSVPQKKRATVVIRGVEQP